MTEQVEIRSNGRSKAGLFLSIPLFVLVVGAVVSAIFIWEARAGMLANKEDVADHENRLRKIEYRMDKNLDEIRRDQKRILEKLP